MRPAAAEPGILICMWDTLRPNETGHGDGLVNTSRR